MIQFRDFKWDKDYFAVCDFLAELYQLTKSLRNWIPSRVENRKFGPCGPPYQDEEDKLVKIWEEFDDGDASKTPKMIAVTIMTDSPDAFINLHPDYAYLEEDIIKQMEEWKRAMPPSDDRGPRIAFFAEEGHTERIELLQKLGYEDLGLWEHNRVRPLDLPVPDYELPEGYSIRHVSLPEDYEKYHEVVSSVFKHCGPHMTEAAAVKYSQASYWNEGLDLVAVAPDGNFAAFTTVRIDPSSGITEFEPVGTHPDYRQKGLAKAIILEGLKRLKNYNPTVICIPGAAVNEGAIKLYDSLGFTRIDVHAWRKFF
jgi:ribosomal protein S18 acetylase RimI-like enzyme